MSDESITHNYKQLFFNENKKEHKISLLDSQNRIIFWGKMISHVKNYTYISILTYISIFLYSP
jgi:hypothetical protein